jgi:hypothetical protein
MATMEGDFSFPPDQLTEVVTGLRGVRRVDIAHGPAPRVVVWVDREVYDAEHHRGLLQRAVELLTRSIHDGAVVVVTVHPSADELSRAAGPTAAPTTR